MVVARKWHFKNYSLVGWGKGTGTGLGEMRGSRRDCEGHGRRCGVTGNRP